MLEPWNDKSVLAPSINTSLTKLNFNLKEMKDIFGTIIHVLSKQSPLHKESAILSRFLYKFDRKFRNDIGYRKFKKVNTALHKYLSLPFLRDIQNFVDMLPSNNETEIYLPTRQMLEYVLIRMMTFSKLMNRITVCSKQAAVFYLDRIRRGESHWMSLMPYALLSRLWSLGLVLLRHSCNWYNQLYPFLKYLPFKGLPFLQNDYELPIHLEKWIDMKQLNDKGRFEWSKKMDINIDSIMVEDDDSDLCENILKFVNNINKKTENSDEHEIQLLLPKYKVSAENILKESDEGEPISRNRYKDLMRLSSIATNTVQKKEEQHLIENVTTSKSLLKFIGNEESYRNESNDLSLTSHLSFMQWQTLKISLLKIDSSLINKRKLEKKIQKIWQEKCLEYLEK